VSRTMLFILLATGLAAVALSVAAVASAAPAKVVGTVGPGHTIDLRMGGKKVTKLKAGVPYRFVVSDRSQEHDFRVVGPGVNKVITSVGFVGQKSVVLKLKAGAYRFYCAPHSDDMRGSFRAVR
jgi:plastocyanin